MRSAYMKPAFGVVIIFVAGSAAGAEDLGTSAQKSSDFSLEADKTRLTLAAAYFQDQPAEQSGPGAEEVTAPAPEGEASATELAKKTQNPVSDLISLPFENNFGFQAGADGEFRYDLIIKPVLPVSLNEDWNWINRVLIPVSSQPNLGPNGIGEACGVGDVQYQGYLSPADSGEWIWGIGPVLAFPTASEDELGTEKWSAGPGFVMLRMSGPWVYGGLINNIWSYAGEGDRESVSFMTLQPFVNYNFEGGWYLSTGPVITANWEADSDDAWTIPLGGGFGRVIRIGELPVNWTLRGYYNVEKPDGAPDWSLQLQVAFLFPKG
jgi:hypothetical protein